MIWAAIVVVVVIALAFKFWYVALPVAVVALSIFLLVRRNDRARLAAMTDAERAAELARRAEKKRRKEQTFKGVTVIDGRITSAEGEWPLAGASARVETAGEITSRLSATRLAAFGPFGLLARKRVDKRELYLTVEGVGFSIVKKLDPNLDGAKARTFAAKVNGLAAAQPAAKATPPAAGPGDLLRELAQLRDSGVITAEEFEAKKAELLGRL